MKFYLGTGIIGVSLISVLGLNSADARQPLTLEPKKIYIDSDSLKVENLAKELKKLKPISAYDLKSKFKNNINGFKLTGADAFEDKERGSGATADYIKGSQNIHIVVTDGAGPGSEEIKGNLLNYLELKKIDERGDGLDIKSYKGWEAYFDSSMFKNDRFTSIQYLENNRYAVVVSANEVPIEELKSFTDNFTLQ
ncbi:hypothetical protein DRF59_06550 [Chryseobacterium flavum]|uniref:Uncharacterized protein n=1 Tax=Chryseobacterium flavum TaxID=415851 RepID=A0A3D9CQJ6_9FLAO|nr:hypothetical protein [Chryseobacterium flavum]REC67969.1 hypothetical protein DRF59_06550 [Chryseobacterium flavum]